MSDELKPSEIAADILRGGHDPRFVSPEIKALAEAFEELNQRTPPADQWISVKDRLPDLPNHRLIVCTNSGDVFDNHYYNQKRREFVFNAGGFNDETTHGVTHWMPLPNPPAKKESS